MIRNRYKWILVLVLALIAAPSFADFTISPGISLTEQYNDNIYLDASDEIDDFITIVSPNVKFGYSPNSTFDINVDYGLNLRYYSDNSDLNETSIKDTQRISLLSHVRPAKRVFIDISDSYERVPIDIRRKTAIDNAVSNMTDRNIFSVSPYVVLPLTDSFSTTIGYSYSTVWNKSDELIDSYSHAAYVTLSKRFSTKASADIRYDYFAYRPDTDSEHVLNDEYDRHQGSVGITYQLTRKLRLNAGVGEASTDYKAAEDKDNTFWNILTEYDFLNEEETSVGAEYSVSLSESALSGSFESRRVDLRFATGKVLHLGISTYYSIHDYMNTDREDKITGVAVNVSRPLTRRINVMLDGEWEDRKFTLLSVDEKVERYSFGSNFDFRMNRNLTASLGYRYNTNNSDLDVNDFNNNIASLQARLAF